MGLLSQMGYVNNGNGWELSSQGKAKASTASKLRIEDFISQAQSAASVQDTDQMNFNKDWAQRIIDSAFANQFIDSNEKFVYENTLNTIL